jgi:glycosyltransferase involved in cell wall biosynthesis
VKLSIIIPTYNEERTIETILRRIAATLFPVEYELVLVDDNSADQTVAIEDRVCRALGPAPIIRLRNRMNKGKGACIRQGLKHATGDYVVVQDGDLEYDPQDLVAMLQPLIQGQQVVVYGSRFLRQRWPKGMAPANLIGNRLLTCFSNALYGTRLTDVMTCYKILPMAALREARVLANRFEYDLEMTAKISRRGHRIVEVPIGYAGRTHRQGKKIKARDFFIGVWTLCRYRWWA